MKIEHAPVTGKEGKDNLRPPMRALSDSMRPSTAGISRKWRGIGRRPMRLSWIILWVVSSAEHLFNSQSQFYFEFYDYSFHAAGEIFYVVGRERGEFRMGKMVLNMAIRTSRIFRLMNSRRQQVHHHGSIDDPDLLSNNQKAIRSA